jgi:predicted proteasome-type protease
MLYTKHSLNVTRYRRLSAGDRDLNLIHSSWEQSLRRAVEQLPDIELEGSSNGISMENSKVAASFKA